MPKKYSHFLVVILLSMLLPAVSFSQDEEGWELAKEKDGVRVYLRDRDDSPIKEFRAVGNVQSSMSSIVALLIDAEAAPDWYNHVKEGELLGQQDNSSHVAYTALAFPWPFTDRDMISRFSYAKDPETGIVRMEVTSLPDYRPAGDKMIRITNIEGYWLLTPISDEEVEVQYQFFADPGGSIPGWLINMFIVEDPLAAMESMREFVQKPRYQEAKVPFLE